VSEKVSKLSELYTYCIVANIKPRLFTEVKKASLTIYATKLRISLKIIRNLQLYDFISMESVVQRDHFFSGKKKDIMEPLVERRLC
jgi:hypothetical protein